MEWLDKLPMGEGSNQVVSRHDGKEVGETEAGVDQVDDGQFVCCELSGFFHPKFLISLLLT